MRGGRPVSLAILAALGAVTTLAVVATVDAISTRSFVIDDAATMAAGELDGAAVHSNGSITPGGKLARIEMPNVPVAFSLARGPDGSAYIGTGNDGKIYRLRGEAMTVFAETRQLLVTSLAFGEGGTLYAGTLPEGRIFAVDPQGQARELARPEGAEHVWALAWDPRRRNLFAASGPDGRVFAITPQGQASVYYDGEPAHIMSLALSNDGTLYAGTSDTALLVRLRGPGRAEVVVDFPGNEVTALSLSGTDLAVVVNDFTPASLISSLTKTTGTVSSPTTVTPTPEAPTPSPTASTTPSSVSAFSSLTRTGKGRLWRVGEDGRAERLYANDESYFTSVQYASDGTIYVGAGKDGRVYRVRDDRTSATWIDVDERQVLALDLAARDPLFVTGDAAVVYRVLPGSATDATWTSKVLDAGFVARFGELAWRATGPVHLQTRSGNTERPDDSWSDWSAAISTAGPTRSPAARFLQVRTRFGADPATTLYAITAYYLPQNQRPVVYGVGVTAAVKTPPSSTTTTSTPATTTPTTPATTTPTTSPTTTTTSLTPSLTLTPPLIGSALSTTGSSPNEGPAKNVRQVKLSWQIDNPDGDRVRYRVRFRSEQQTLFRPTQRDSDVLSTPSLTWDTSGVPDGYYVVQVEASDELSNPSDSTLRSTAESEPILVDNHPPEIEDLQATGTTVRGRIVDGLGPIAKLERSIDGGEWLLFYPTDNLLDTQNETFELNLSTLEPGEHIVTVRATDAGGNETTAAVTVRAAPPRRP